jgi:antitoxin (DNA-binding transcriptional repressor) of toxin-antitoxin stability system
MEDVTLAHAKEHLEELVERAARGEVVRIVDAKLGTIQLTPSAELPAVLPAAKPERRPGRWKDRLPPPPDDFFEPLSEEELKHWYVDDP